MASIEEVEGWISDGKYPHVARTSDPLIVRVSRFSLLVNDTNFYAKVKNGLGYKGYLIYSSGLGTPILEESATNETEFFSNDAFKKAISDNGTNTKDKFYESTERVQTVLQDAAQSWLDTIELEIAKQPNDNAIKKAIDRLCWQLHYDITASDTDFTQFDDFSDVQIDSALNTFYKTVTDSTSDIGSAIGESATTIVGSSSSSSGLWSIADNISSFNKDLAGNNGAIKQYVGDKLYSGIDTDISTRLNKIATNLKADVDSYTISKALREESQASVSGATYQQTQLEQEHFTEVSVNQLGAFGTGASGEAGHRTLFSTIGSYALDGNNTVEQAVGQTADGESSDSLTGRVEKIKITIGDSDGGLVKTVGGIDTKMGVPLNENGQEMTTGGDTLFDAVYRHPGFLGYNNHGFGGNLPSTNASLVSEINHDVLSGTTGIKGTVNTINGTVNTLNNKIGSVPSSTGWSVYKYLTEIYSSV